MDKDMLKITLSKAVKFEDKEYKEVDLSGLENLTAEALCRADNRMSRMGIVAPVKEMNYEFCTIIAAEATELPVEFFKALPAKDFSRIARAISAFFLGAE